MDGEDDVHPVPNVDVQGIIFSGKKIKVPAELLVHPHQKQEAPLVSKKSESFLKQGGSMNGVY